MTGMLDKLMRQHNLSNAEVARLCGVSESLVSLVRRQKFNGNQEEKEEELISILAEKGYVLQPEKLKVKGDAFVQTRNVQAFDGLCRELLETEDLTSSIGVVTGLAGRGKTFSARHFVAGHQEAVYVLFVDGFSLVDVLREVAFELSGVRPRMFRQCLDVVDRETARQRRLIVIDEADKMPHRYIEMLRALNERCSCPMVLVGEEPIVGMLQRERRLRSRVRQVVEFEPVAVADVVAFWRVAVGMEISPEVARLLWKRSEGDFRNVVRDAHALVRKMNASGLQVVTEEVVKSL